ncbi:hypothetical protein K2173_004455 [Erythroxylum novogranatense]|uniref:Uncharacterized protein n=1 Tax=Erythroxylum novogranatense TaxID=1862640 RepID=A0AAV8T5U7_9ROSI|nr:hypothetical protein K2173_004455 [Erythroxylum novogranatense]
MKPKLKHTYCPPSESPEQRIVAPPMHALRAGLNRWRSTLEGFFIDNRIVFPVMKHWAFNRQKQYGLTEVLELLLGDEEKYAVPKHAKTGTVEASPVTDHNTYMLDTPNEDAGPAHPLLCTANGATDLEVENACIQATHHAHTGYQIQATNTVVQATIIPNNSREDAIEQRSNFLVNNTVNSADIDKSPPIMVQQLGLHASCTDELHTGHLENTTSVISGNNTQIPPTNIASEFETVTRHSNMNLLTLNVKGANAPNKQLMI